MSKPYKQFCESCLSDDCNHCEKLKAYKQGYADAERQSVLCTVVADEIICQGHKYILAESVKDSDRFYKTKANLIEWVKERAKENGIKQGREDAIEEFLTKMPYAHMNTGAYGDGFDHACKTARTIAEQMKGENR